MNEYTKKLKLLLITSLVGPTIIGCNGGGNNSNTGSSTQQWSISDLQTALSNDVCSSLSKDSVGVNLCFKNKNYIAESSVFGNFQIDSEVANNSSNVSSVNYYAVNYASTGVDESSITASGLIEVPNIPTAKIKGVVLYYHSLILSKNSAPSNVSNNNLAKLLASIYAAQGYYVIIPDGIGFGSNSSAMNPSIMFPNSSAQNGLNILPTFRKLLKDNYNVESSNNLPLYIASYGAGGIDALTANKILDTNPISGFTLKRTVANSGAYDLPSTFGYMVQNAFNNPESNTYNLSPGGSASDINYGQQNALARLSTSVGKAWCSSYALSAFKNYTGIPVDILNPTYQNLQSCMNTSSTGELNLSQCSPYYSVSGLIMGNSASLTDSFIAAQMFNGAVGSSNYFTGSAYSFPMNVTDFLTSIYNNPSNYSNSIAGPILSSAVYTNQDMMNGFMQYLTGVSPFVAANSGGGFAKTFTTSTPVSVIDMKYDSIYPNFNTYEAANGGIVGNVTYVQLDNTNMYSRILDLPGFPATAGYLEHNYAETILNLIALNQIQDAK